MQSRDFCFWLQGFFELRDFEPGAGTVITESQVEKIKEHLALVFEEFGRPAMGKIFSLGGNMNGDESHRIC